MPSYLVFTADWCVPCSTLKTNLELLRDVSALPEDLEIVDIAADQDLVQKYAIRAVPTIVRISGGVETGRKVGEVDFANLNQFFKEES